MSAAAYRRIELLADAGSFRETPPVGEGGYITGRIRLNGRQMHVSATNPEPTRLSPMESLAKQIAFFEEVSKSPAPMALLVDAPGHVAQAGGMTPIPPQADLVLASERGMGRLYCLQARLKGLVPQVAVALGRLGAALSFPLALADVAVMAKGSAVCVGRPDAVRSMTGQETDFESLGGARLHCTVSGLGAFLAEDEAQALTWARSWLAMVPAQAGGAWPAAAPKEPASSLAEIGARLPADPNRPFDMRAVVEGLVDADSLVEIRRLHASECLVGLARVKGLAAGILANNSFKRGGIIFPETCRKMIDFIQFCDRFGLPMIFLADNPGFMVGPDMERAGIVRAGADLMSAIACARTPKICVVVRKAYTAGLYAMAGPGFDSTEFWGMPGASISIFGPKALVRFAAARELDEAGKARVEQMRRQSQDPAILEQKGLMDAVVAWPNLRGELAGFLESSQARREET